LFAYGLANEWVRPQYAGYTGYIVSARSVHGFWLRRQIPFEISSEDDESPQYRPSGNEKDSAREVGMSRTTFAERFKSLVGQRLLST
jgi:AraC-like DNA-binding protein